MKILLMLGMTLTLTTVLALGCDDSKTTETPAPAAKATAPVIVETTEETGVVDNTGTDAPTSEVLGNPAEDTMKAGEMKTDGTVITTEILAGKNFTLVSVNGEKFSGESTPTLAFGEDLRVSGRVCNNFNGQAVLAEGMLKAGPLAATRMACPPGPLGQLEQDLFAMLGASVAVSLEGSVLTLTQGDTTLVYEVAVEPAKAE